MKKQLGLYILLPTLILTLGLVMACGGSGDPETVPITLPTDSTPQSSRPLSASELMVVDEFATQQEAVGLEWDQFHKDFDHWRAGLTSCHESTAQNALRDFAVAFNGVTEQARDLPRATVTRELADVLIAAAESEEKAFRQLRDRWQPNNLSLFETVEQQRSESALAQRTVQDQVAELQEDLEKATDPERLQAIEDLSEALDAIGDAWESSHDDYSGLLKESETLDNAKVLIRLNQLIEQLDEVVDSIDRLTATDATKDMIGELQKVAEAEQAALSNTLKVVRQAIMAALEIDDEPATPEPETSSQTIAPLLKAPQAAIKKSQATLKEVNLSIEDSLDGSAEEDLQDLGEFVDGYESLLASWGAFHEGYNGWREVEGGCDRTEVLKALSQFNIRISELGLQVRDLPQSGYLLPMYNLLVEAVEREEGAVRTLRTSWQPFTVDAFIAVDRERDNANKLRREASIALVELTDRS